MSSGANNKDKMRTLIETTVVDRLKTIFKENEMVLEKELMNKLEAEKDDVNGKYVKGKIHEVAESNEFGIQQEYLGKFAQSINQCRNLTQVYKTRYVKILEDLQKLFEGIDSAPKDSPVLKIKINNYIGELTKQTFVLIGQMHDEFVRLDQAGAFGKGKAIASFDLKFNEFEFKAILWQTITSLDNNSVEYQVLKQGFDEKMFRQFMSSLITQTYPDQVGDTLTVEKEVIKYIEVPKVQIVEKTNTVEKPIVVEKIVEKVIVQEVEKRVPEIHEVIKEVIKIVSIPDRIREAHELLFGMGKPQNITDALNIYYEEAEVNSNVLAFNAIGQIFLEGKFFPKDLNKSFIYFEKSAQANDPEGLYRIGYFLFNNIVDGFQLSQGRLDNRDKEIEEAIIYFQKASELGHLDALTDLGEIFEHGIPSALQEGVAKIEPELEQAEFYYTQGKKVRYPRAICLLGQFYLNNPDYKQKIRGDNARKAIKYFELARNLGYTKAILQLAQCYEKGLGVPINKEASKNFYKEGALKGDLQCKIQYMHYVMFDASNSGRQEEYTFAFNYFSEIMITHPNVPETYFYLGHLYECGFGVVKDPQVALSYFHKGAQRGNASCMNKLGDFYHSGFGIGKNYKEAMRWYQQAAALNDPQALLNLGIVYEEGYDTIAPNREKAFQYYSQAAQLDSPEAYYYLGLMYEAGRYVEKDRRKAIELFKKSAHLGYLEAREHLEQKSIPMIYADAFDTSDKYGDTYLEEQGLFSPQDQRFGTYREDKPMISHPMVTQMGKKSNQNILQSKLDKQQLQEGGRPKSILVFNATLQAQSQFKNLGSDSQ